MGDPKVKTFQFLMSNPNDIVANTDFSKSFKNVLQITFTVQSLPNWVPTNYLLQPSEFLAVKAPNRK